MFSLKSQLLSRANVIFYDKAKTTKAITARVTPIYTSGDKTSFKTKNPSKFASIIETAPKSAIVFPSSIAVNT